MKNDPRLAGQVAGKGSLFGPFSRFKVFPIHTRFESVNWFVTDVETLDEDGLPCVVAQADRREEAVAITLRSLK